MALPYTFNNTVYAAGFFGTDDGGAPTNATHSFGLDSTYDFPVTVNGTVSAPGDTITITYTVPGNTTPTTQTLTATQYDNSNMVLFIGTNGVPGAEDGTTNRFVFSNVMMYGNPPPTGQTRTRFIDDGDSMLDSFTVQCFASGTLIRTSAGDVAVERLEVGDLVVTGSGELRPIRWLGHRVIECNDGPTAHDMRPVRIRAGAFGVGADGSTLPERDLQMSPGHPVLVGADENNEGGHLVPIMCLINGTTIERMAAESVVYWHVELDGSHDILLAEGLPAESYLEWSDRQFFDEGSDFALHNPDHVVPGLAARCRPVAIDGPVVEAERRRLDGVFAAKLASKCAWPSAEAFALGF